MKTFIPFSILIISGLIAVGSLVYSVYNDSKSISLGKDSIKRVVINSFLYGISGATGWITITMIGWWVDRTNRFSINSLYPSLTLSCIIGVFLLVMSLWRYFVIGHYKDWLIGKISQKR